MVTRQYLEFSEGRYDDTWIALEVDAKNWFRGRKNALQSVNIIDDDKHIHATFFGTFINRHEAQQLVMRYERGEGVRRVNLGG